MWYMFVTDLVFLLPPSVKILFTLQNAWCIFQEIKKLRCFELKKMLIFYRDLSAYLNAAITMKKELRECTCQTEVVVDLLL